MESMNWAPEHSDALRESLANRMSFSEIVKAINSKFGTAYTRSAAIGRARRLKFAEAGRSDAPPISGSLRTDRPFEPRAAELKLIARHSRILARKKIKKPELRCVEVEPRHLPLTELERGDCRYPYGGDAEGEAITFCGHPRQPGSSYCMPHFHLSRNPAVSPAREFTATGLRIAEGT